MKDNDTIYHLTESLIELVYFSIISIFLKSCDKMWLALDRVHHIKGNFMLYYYDFFSF